MKEFLKNAKYQSKLDFSMIHGIYVRRLPTPSNYYPDGLTVESFKKWINEGYGCCDVVNHNGDLCIVKTWNEKTTNVCFTIKGANTEIIDEKEHELLNEELKPANEYETGIVYGYLRSNNLEFFNPFPCVAEKYLPKSNDIVEFHKYDSDINGVGVVRMVIPNGNVTMYCLYFYPNKDNENGEVIYNMHYELGNINEYSFCTVDTSSYQRKNLETKLNSVNKSWNHPLRRIEPCDLRCERGGEYYYINDKLVVTKDTDQYTALSNKRFNAGNYYRKIEDALRIQTKIAEMYREYLVTSA